MRVNLPGIGDTVIKQAVPPGGDLCIALGQVEACDLPKRGRLGCAIFGSGGLRSRVPRTTKHKATSTQCRNYAPVMIGLVCNGSRSNWCV